MKLAVFLVVSVVVARILPLFGGGGALEQVANWSPLVALVLCGSVYFKGRLVFLPLAGFLLSEVILNVGWHFRLHEDANGLGASIFAGHSGLALGVYGFICLTGSRFRDSRRNLRVPALLGGSVLGAVVFYLVTNTGSFLFSVGYEKSLAGWIQCLTVGLPGFPPTWTFLVKSLVANLVFMGVFVALFDWKLKPNEVREERVPATTG